MMWSCLKQETPGVTRGTSGPLSFSSLHTLAKILFKSRLEDGVTAESWTNSSAGWRTTGVDTAAWWLFTRRFALFLLNFEQRLLHLLPFSSWKFGQFQRRDNRSRIVGHDGRKRWPRCDWRCGIDLNPNFRAHELEWRRQVHEFFWGIFPKIVHC